MIMLVKNCPKCNKEISYVNKSNYNRSIKINALCYTCANDTRKGRKRTPDQCHRISEATKVAMKIPKIYKKFLESYTPENKRRRSESTKRQMNLLFLDTERLSIYLEKQKIKGKKQWESLTTQEKNNLLHKVWSGCKKKWSNPVYKKIASIRMTGNKNPFYGKHHSPETIEKLRKATTDRLIKFWESKKLIGFDTVPEKKFKKLLQENNIEFTSQFPLKNKIYDVYIPKYNTIIEIDGCYWHNKNIPLSKMNSQQLRRWKNDRYKDDLACKNGYKLLRVWEDEIEKFNIEKELINE